MTNMKKGVETWALPVIGSLDAKLSWSICRIKGNEAIIKTS
jgi:hypothetical protein